jgi:hypothetical protein
MRRTLLTGLSLFVAAGIGACLMHVELEPAALAEPQSPRRHPSPTPFDPFTPGAHDESRVVKLVPRIVYESVRISTSDADQRSAEFSTLMQQKAERMSNEELDQAIKELKAELDAQNKAADAELQQVIDSLERLVKESAGTPAAERARLALTVLKHQTPPMPQSYDSAPRQKYAPAYPQPAELPPVPTN